MSLSKQSAPESAMSGATIIVNLVADHLANGGQESEGSVDGVDQAHEPSSRDGYVAHKLMNPDEPEPRGEMDQHQARIIDHLAGAVALIISNENPPSTSDAIHVQHGREQDFENHAVQVVSLCREQPGPYEQVILADNILHNDHKRLAHMLISSGGFWEELETIRPGETNPIIAEHIRLFVAKFVINLRNRDQQPGN